jgi:aspartokinase
VITIAQTVQELVSASPLLEEALSDGIINFSALARKLRPKIAERHMTPVREGAIVMALKRMAESGTQKQMNSLRVHEVRNITVRSNLVEFSFRNSSSLSTVLRKLGQLAEKKDDSFVNFAQGVFETTLIVSESLAKEVKQMTEKEILIKRYDGLSSISVRTPDHTADTPGVYYPFFRAFAWENINFIEIISVYSELTFVVEDKDVDRAFVVVKALSKKA